MKANKKMSRIYAIIKQVDPADAVLSKIRSDWPSKLNDLLRNIIILEVKLNLQ